MKSDHLYLNSDKTQFIWVGTRQQLASVSVTEIVLNGYRIKTSPIVTCLGVTIDAELTFSTHVKQVAARCFYQLRQLWSIRLALTFYRQSRTNRLQALSSRPPACRPVPRVNDLSSFGSVNTVTRHHLRSAGQGDLTVPRTRTVGFGPGSFSVASPSLWNTAV